MTDDEKRMQFLAECMRRLVCAVVPEGIKVCVILADERAWAAQGDTTLVHPVAEAVVREPHKVSDAFN